MWGAIGAFIGLLVLLLKEFFSASAREREAGREFKLNRETYKKLVQAALDKQLATMAEISAGQGSGWDSADGDANRPR